MAEQNSVQRGERTKYDLETYRPGQRTPYSFSADQKQQVINYSTISEHICEKGPYDAKN